MLFLPSTVLIGLIYYHAVTKEQTQQLEAITEMYYSH